MNPRRVSENGRMVDWSKCPLLESVPDRCHGAWTFKDSRFMIYIVFDNLAAGLSVREIVDVFGGVTEEQIVALLEYVSQSLHDEADAALKHDGNPGP